MNSFDNKIMIEIADWTMTKLEEDGMITSADFQKQLGLIIGKLEEDTLDSSILS